MSDLRDLATAIGDSTGVGDPAPPAVTVCPARTPLRATLVCHRDEPAPEDADYGEPVLQVVVGDFADPDGPPDALIHVVNVAAAPWPYCEVWGEALTPARALRLAAMLTAAAATVQATGR